MDTDMNYCAVEKLREDMHTFTERFEHKYGQFGYILDEFKRVRPGPKTKVVSFSSLMDILKSKDPSLLEQNKWIFEGDSKFLDVS